MRYREKGAVCPAIPGTAGHVLPCHSGNSGSRSVLSHFSMLSSAVLHVAEIPIDCEGVVHGAAALAQVQHGRQST